MIIRNIIFDFDGTLVDSAPCILTCYKLVLEERNITPSVAINERIIGPPLTETLTLLTEVSKQDEIALMADRFKYHYDERVAAETLPYAGIAALLASLQNTKIKLYIATNKRILPTMKIIDYLGWQDFFVSIRAIDQLALGRQNKSTLLSDILIEHQIAPETALYIGDKPDDAAAAKANNLGFLAASWGYGDWDRNDSEILYAPADLRKHVLSNNG